MTGANTTTPSASCPMPGDLPPCPLLLDILPAGLLMVDAEGRIRTWNRAMELLTGYRPEEVLGKSCRDFACATCPHRSGPAAALPCRFLAPENATGIAGQAAMDGIECVIRAKTGELVPVLKNTRVLMDEDGRPNGLLETLSDLRPLKKLERDIARLKQNAPPKAAMGKIIGASAVMHEVFERIRLAAESDAAVLLLGETGTGKERVAEAIHNHSARKNGPFIKVNCSALAETLLEAELFGHVRGAFTGAVHDKIGRFEAADGGTILLDEIGDIAPLIQLKLLRVLQEREFERVGESTPRRVDVRVICATHRNLRKLVREGTFREDLFYRIRVFPIELPPLRRRKSDIPLLTEAFIQRFNRQTGKNIRGLTPNALHCLMDYCWPGNVRELENAIEHAFVICQTDHIDLFDLPTEIRMAELRSAYCREYQPAGATEVADLRAQPAANSREELLAVLRECGWNQSEAARRLGVDRSTVWRKMKRWQITPP